MTLSTAAEGPGAATALEVSLAKAAAGPEAAAKANAEGSSSEDATVSTIQDASALLARLRSRAVLTAMGVEGDSASQAAASASAPRLVVPAGGAAWHGVLP